MKFGLVFPWIDPRTFARLARLAEENGWQGAFYWDGIEWGEQVTYDPWIVLSAAAAQTEHIRLGPMVCAVPRRRPWKLARETVSLDHLSAGRLVLPVGLGAVEDGAFSKVGEPTDRKVSAELLDESLSILAGLWSGQPFTFTGKHYRFAEMTFRPVPVQQPRIPIWVVGALGREKSMARALSWDGILPTRLASPGDTAEITPDDIFRLRETVRSRHPHPEEFEIVMEGETSAEPAAAAASRLRVLAEAGATWWVESIWSKVWEQGGLEGMERRIRQGPPAV